VTSADQGAWSFATARVPSQFSAAVDPLAPNAEHALGHDATLCGIAGENVTVYRHLFHPGDASACPACRELAAAAPTQPSGQERLHNKVLAATPGQVRDELIDALRTGARIRLWIEGPAKGLAKHYARLDQIVEGGPAVAAALRTDDRIGLAKVDHDCWQFIIVLPHDDPPVIARAAAEK
jgi:hypothetical protein